MPHIHKPAQHETTESSTRNAWETEELAQYLTGDRDVKIQHPRKYLENPQFVSRKNMCF